MDRREIAGYVAELSTLLLETDTGSGVPSARSLECWTVADLDAIVDREALLRAQCPADPPYWALPWIGARAIAAKLLAEPLEPTSRVLEIGCGLGLAGVAAGKSDATNRSASPGGADSNHDARFEGEGPFVLFTDYVDAALAFARANAEHHGLARFETRALDFTSDRIDARFDCIIAADVVYEPASYEPLVRFLDEHASDGATVLLTESLRADAKRVLDALSTRGFSRTTQAVWVPEDGKRERTWLHELRRR